MNHPVADPGAPTPNRSRLGFAARGGWWVAGQFLLMVGVLAAGLRFPGASAWAWPRTASAFLLLAGAGFGIAGALHLGANRTAYPAPVDGGHLVQTGIYAWVRHPLYSSLIFLSAGWSLWHWSWMAGVAALGLGILLTAKARLEEQWLRQRYSGYADYARRVRRFIPGVW